MDLIAKMCISIFPNKTGLWFFTLQVLFKQEKKVRKIQQQKQQNRGEKNNNEQTANWTTKILEKKQEIGLQNKQELGSFV